MEKEYLLVLIDGQEKKAEIIDTSSGINRYNLLLDGKRYTFQYNNHYYSDPHFKFIWVEGYLIHGKAFYNCQIKHIKP